MTSSRGTRAATSLPHFESPSRDQPPIRTPFSVTRFNKIAAEALRNAFRHAQARRLEVEIRYDDEQSPGCAYVTTAGASMRPARGQGVRGHYGLRGMPERAALIGGKLAVWSQLGAGTEVELRLPATIVYATSRRRSWWSRLFASRSPA